jgi:hypothetical protein
LKVLWLHRSMLATAVNIGLVWIACSGAGNLVSAPEIRGTSPLAAFAVGERLVYGVQWNPPAYLFFLPSMEAGQAILNLAGETQFQNKKALKIVFTARSSGMLAKLAQVTVDDYYEFTTDANTLCTYAVVKREREGKRMRDIDIIYSQDSPKLHLREVDVSGPLKRVLRDQDYEGIPPCVKDLFSALYSIRRRRLEIGGSERVLVGDNQVVKEVEIRVLQKEKVSTEIGRVDSLLVDTVAVMGGLFKSGGQFRIWLSDDERQMPVKFEIKVSVGKVTGILREARPGGAPAEPASPKKLPD